MVKSSWSHALVWASLAGALAGCSSVPDSHAPTSPLSGARLLVDDRNGEPVPKVEPPSRSGNPDTYRVSGRRYRVKETSAGYREQGTASWYGWDFHGRKTSSGPLYNMFDLTAAHKSLPIPTYVRVTNLENGRNVVVKVNDRGPFVGRRIIDLSYAAADRLGMLGQGVADVEVVALEPYQSLPELAARRAEARERLAGRRGRSESKFEPTTIAFAHEESVQLAASELSQSALSRPELVATRIETPESPIHRQAAAELKPEPTRIEVVREEPIRPVAPELSSSELAAIRPEMPAARTNSQIQPEPKLETITDQITREDSVRPTALVVDTPATRSVTATAVERNTTRARSSARLKAPVVARAVPKVAANPAPAVAKSPTKNRGQEDQTRVPLHLASAETALKGKTAGEQRHPSTATSGKNSRLEPTAPPTGHHRDGRSSERSNETTRRDTRKLSDSVNRQENQAPARESNATKSAAVRLAGLKAGRPRIVTD